MVKLLGMQYAQIVFMQSDFFLNPRIVLNYFPYSFIDIRSDNINIPFKKTIFFVLFVKLTIIKVITRFG